MTTSYLRILENTEIYWVTIAKKWVDCWLIAGSSTPVLRTNKAKILFSITLTH